MKHKAESPEASKEGASQSPRESDQTVSEGDVEERAARLTTYIFYCPPVKATLGLVVGLGLLAGLALEPSPSGLLWGLAGAAALVALGLGLLPLLVRLAGGELFRPHAGLTLAFTQGVALLLVVVGRLVSPFWERPTYEWLALGWGVAAAFWLLALRALATSSAAAWPLALGPPLAQGSVLTQGLVGSAGWTPLLWALTLLPLASLGLLHLVDRPFQRALGVRGFDLMRHFIAYLRRDERTLEAELARFALEADLQAGLVAYRRPGADRPYLLLVVPTHHPGPLGELGGSNLPQRLATQLRSQADHIMVLHGASINDQNPIHGTAIDRLASALGQLLAGLEYEPTATLPAWSGNENGCVGQRFGSEGTLLLALPHLTLYDDIEPAVAQVAQARAREILGGNALLGDCHSQLAVNAPHLTLESPQASQLLGRVARVARSLQEQPAQPFQTGYGQAGGFDLRLGLGPMGLQALMVEVADQRAAYLLADANGLDPKVRAELLEELEPLVDHLIFCTSDNHYLNTLRGGHNPLGHGRRWERVVALAKEALEQAAADLAPSEAAMGLTTVERELVFGHGNSVRMASLVNSVAAAARVAWLPLYGSASLLYWVVVSFLV